MAHGKVDDNKEKSEKRVIFHKYGEKNAPIVVFCLLDSDEKKCVF
jgi:hypothetical protein